MNMKTLEDKYIKSIEVYKFCKLFASVNNSNQKDLLNLEESKKELIFYNRAIRKSILVNKNNKIFCKKSVIIKTSNMYKKELEKLLS